MTTQLFCVRKEAAIGLAVVLVDLDSREITLLKTHLAFGDSIDDFPKDLADIVSRFQVSKIFVSPLREQPRPKLRDLQAFKKISREIDLREMDYFVSQADGKMAWTEARNSGKLKDDLVYEQLKKLRARIKRIDGKSDLSPDVHACLCAVALAKPIFPFDPDSMAATEDLINDYGNSGGYGYGDDDYGGGRATHTAYGVFRER